MSHEFDIFLCHNNKDKYRIKEIGNELKEYGLNPWLDEWNLRPGFPWQRELEKQIANIGAAAVFVSSNGIGPWQEEEIEAYLREFIERKCPVIPVLLENIEKIPTLPIFLKGRTWVDFSNSNPDPMEQLIFGITGKIIKKLNKQILDGNKFSIASNINYYKLGKEFYNKSKYIEAYEWYKKAADQGYSAAQYNIGVLYNNGYGVSQDYNKAYEWYKKAANQGYSAAQYNIGVLYNNGYGVSQDYNKAYEWCKKAAAQGYSAAQSGIGVLHNNGQGVSQDYNKAYEWYKKAADQGYSAAQFGIGFLYNNGYGVSQDYNKAYEWYKKAADQGDSDAQYNIGVLYNNGYWVTQDYSKAYEWYKKVTAQGHLNAQKNINKLKIKF